MTFGLLPLETELPIPPLGFGLIAFGLLVLFMLITLSIGKGRHHS